MSINIPVSASPAPADPLHPVGRLDPGGTQLRLRALHVMGHGSARIARALGVRETAIRELVRGDARTVSPCLRDMVLTLYDAWWDKRAPERTRFERGAATAARKRAIVGNWCAAAALDDDQLDTPGYRPRQGWKPATGTGTAPDIRLSPRPPAQEERRHVNMDRQTHRMTSEIITILEAHGHHAADREHADQAVAMINDLAQTYDGSRDTAPTADRPNAAASHPGPRPSVQQADPDTLVLSGVDIGTAFAAFDLAAEYKRDRAETCADCTNQSCETCRTRLRDAETYDRLANRILLQRLATRSADHGQPEPGNPTSSSSRTDPETDKEAGQ